jgi:hypothetical protein
MLTKFKRSSILALAVGALLLGGCQSAGPKVPEGPFRSELHVLDELSPGASREDVATGPILADALTVFSEALVSMNAEVPSGAGVRLELRVGRRVGGAAGGQAEGQIAWSPWLFVCDWGDAPPGGEKVVAFDHLVAAGGAAGEPVAAKGKIDVDCFVSEEVFTAAQVRVIASRGGREPAGAVRVSRVALTLTDGTRPVPGAEEVELSRWIAASGGDRSAWKEPSVIDVPFYSQRTEKPEIAGRICSPTSVTMVMGSRGVSLPVQRVADTAFDTSHDIYGNWPRNIQAAFSFGVPGYLTRFSRWSDVERTLRAGQPIIASIQVKKGELKGSPYPETGGHLIVLRGVDANGDIVVNDPAVEDAAKGTLTYRRRDLEIVWLRRTAGTSYVLLRPDASTASTEINR